MASDKVKRLMDFRKRTYALLSMQASLESSTIIDIVERAIESYANPSVKEIINSEYGDWEERAKTKKSGRPKTKNIESKREEVIKHNERKDNNFTENNIDTTIEVEIKNTSNNETDLTDEEKKLLQCYK